MDDPQDVMARLRPLREAGVQIALDDFGMGYAGLHQLQQKTINQRLFRPQVTRDYGLTTSLCRSLKGGWKKRSIWKLGGK